MLTFCLKSLCWQNVTIARWIFKLYPPPPSLRSAGRVCTPPPGRRTASHHVTGMQDMWKRGLLKRSRHTYIAQATANWICWNRQHEMLNVLSKCLQIHCVDSMLALFFERRSIVYTLRDHATRAELPISLKYWKFSRRTYLKASQATLGP